MNRVVFSEYVIEYLNELVDILIDNEYFGFEDSSVEYINDIVDEIVANIDKKLKKVAPYYFSKYGNNLQYIVYRRSKNTQWYVFFAKKDNTYYIEYIGNNHSIAQYL